MLNVNKNQAPVIAVVGLGYVGMPLLIEFSKQYKTIGFDISRKKIESYRLGTDPNAEIPDQDMQFLLESESLLTYDPTALNGADVFIVAVPTPVSSTHVPEMSALESASRLVGRHMKKGSVVIFESTVFPGATEEMCVGLIESESGLAWKKDFNVGYSPERINPGDKQHTIRNIVKVVSADSGKTLEFISSLYGSIIPAGTHRVSSIKVAEAAKVLENTQRDLNIALMNEVSIIFEKMGIPTREVLEAAKTKWNFLHFRPGLVGGHCVGVDPYYLTHKAEMIGYHPQVILAGRRINDGMSKFVAEKTIKMMLAKGSGIKGSNVVLLGITFKENCSDVRNSKVVDLYEELIEYGCKVHIHDPIADADVVREEFGLDLLNWQDLPPHSDALVIAVAHDYYISKPIDELMEKVREGGCVVDIQGLFPTTYDRDYWSL